MNERRTLSQVIKDLQRLEKDQSSYRINVAKDVLESAAEELNKIAMDLTM
jgi:hypothetical protein